MQGLFFNLFFFFLLVIPGIRAFAQSPGEAPYTLPVFFEPAPDALKLSPPLIEYDLQSGAGRSLRWGPLNLNETFFSVDFTSRQKLDPKGTQITFYNQDDMVLFFNWPSELLRYGTLTVTNSKGVSVWTQHIYEAEILRWQAKILQVKEQLRKQGQKEEDIENNLLLKKTFAFFRSKSDPGPDLRINEQYQFCLKSAAKEIFARICTPFYAVKLSGSHIEMALAPESEKSSPPQVQYQDTPQPLAGKIQTEPGKTAHIFFRLKSGAEIEFASRPPALKIQDMVLQSEQDPDLSQIVAENPAPVFHSSEPLSNPDPLHPLNRFWKASFRLSEGRLYLPGELGGFFQYDLKAGPLPSEKNRLYGNENFRSATYLEKETRHFRQAGKAELETWEVVAPQAGQWNRSYLAPKGESHNYKPYLDVYRGYAGEASLRLTGVATRGLSLAVLAEAHASYWFNSLAGWDHPSLSRQRWGLSAKHLSLLTPLPVSTGSGASEKVQIQSTLVDLKYRFNPGLWERDETWGAILSYENLHHAEYTVPKLGYGFFWARSMPQVFDRIFNLLPIFRSPKWVDLEVVQYPTSLDSQYALGDTFNVNFHGKILWTPRFYGEAGFGAKKYYFLRHDTLRGGELNTFYGTLGLGLNF